MPRDPRSWVIEWIMSILERIILTGSANFAL
jgi:hypothetical protein